MKVAHFAEQAMQRGLIDHLAGKNRFPVRLVDHHQSAQPGRPALIELLFETNPVDCHHSSFRVPLTARRRATHCSTACHSLLDGVPRESSLKSVADSRGRRQYPKGVFTGCFLRSLIAHLLLQKTGRSRFHDDLSAAAYAEFSTNVQDVFLDRVDTEDEVTGNLPVGGTIQ